MSLRPQGVESHIETHHVDVRLTDQAEKASFDRLRDEIANLRLRQATRLGDARHLEERGRRRDVRVEAAGGRRDEVGRASCRERVSTIV